MNGSTTAVIFCPKCRKRYRWSAAIAGRRVRCPCGGMIELPAQMPVQEEILELAQVPAPVAPKRVAAQPPLIARPNHPAEAEVDPDRIKNFQMPLWLLVGGLVIQVGHAFLASRHDFTVAITEIAVELVLATFLMLAGVLIAAKLRGVSLGTLSTAAFKLAAISVAPSAVAMIVAPAVAWFPVFGGFAAPLIAFILRFALLGALFDLDESDTWYFLAIMFIVGVGVYFAARLLPI